MKYSHELLAETAVRWARSHDDCCVDDLAGGVEVLLLGRDVGARFVHCGECRRLGLLQLRQQPTHVEQICRKD